MEALIVGLIIVAAVFLVRRSNQSRSDPKNHQRPLNGIPSATIYRPFEANSATRTKPPTTITGHAYVVDGDKITIQKTQIRLFGIDAPEIDHPYGQRAKWALVALCKGHRIRAEVLQTDDHGRTVAKCYLPDNRDLSAEMTKQGLAIDWPKFSGGAYRTFEQPGVRKKLWLADARQKGRMHVWKKFEAQKNAKAK